MNCTETKPASCSVCRSPYRTEIEATFAAPTAWEQPGIFVELAVRYRLTAGAIRRHVRSHERGDGDGATKDRLAAFLRRVGPDTAAQAITDALRQHPEAMALLVALAPTAEAPALNRRGGAP